MFQAAFVMDEGVDPGGGNERRTRATPSHHTSAVPPPMASLARLACCATNSSTRRNWRQGGSRAHRSHWSRPCACAGRTARLARDRAHVAGTSDRAVTRVTSGDFVENRDLSPRVGPLRSHTPSRGVSTLTVIPVLRIADGHCWCTGRRRIASCRACERVAIVASASRISRQGLPRRLARFRAGGDSSLRGRSIRPGRTTSTTKSHRATAVLAIRARLRYRPARAKPETVHPARTVSRRVKGHQVALPACLDPTSKEWMRAARTAATGGTRSGRGERSTSMCHEIQRQLEG
jgi:hypothetical protein